MREIVLDTETTGLDPAAGHRIVEIGAVELSHHIPTGAEYHVYLNPERDMPPEAFKLHGLTTEFLSEHKKFEEVVDDFLTFIGTAPLVIHNAVFDLNFLNAELALVGRAGIDDRRAIDTLLMARHNFPGARASLDALCQRFSIDLTTRDKHGALIDAHLLAAVYLELVGGRQPGLDLQKDDSPVMPNAVDRRYREPRPGLPGGQPTNAERAAHRAFLEKLKDMSDGSGPPIWLAD
ncbi:MAG: DNA polymerase III subunit epsilon [Rhodospirillaceae bacterium]|nr:DNA polymerase III subunit epsilon [Rhodospirillaceae bacterium]